MLHTHAVRLPVIGFAGLVLASFMSCGPSTMDASDDCLNLPCPVAAQEVRCAGKNPNPLHCNNTTVDAGSGGTGGSGGGSTGGSGGGSTGGSGGGSTGGSGGGTTGGSGGGTTGGSGGGATGGSGGGATGGSGGGATGGSAEPMWHADADVDVDSGDHTRFWKKEVTSGDMSRLTVVNDPKGQYGKVYQAYLTPADIAAGNKRAEFSQALLGDGSTKLKLAVASTPKGSTEEIWFGWRSLFNQDIVSVASHDNDGNFMQLKGDSSCGGPAVGMTIKFGRLTLRSEQYLPQYNDIAWNGPTFSTLVDAWHSYVLHVRFSKDPSIGYLEVWLDGVAQTLMNGQKRLYFQAVCANDTYIFPKLGTYGMDSAIGAGPHHWFESPRIGTSYEAVAPR